MLINGKRALAYTVAVEEIKPIEGYDKVEYARVLGWWCIVTKDYGLKVGDKVVYFEIDSKVPDTNPAFAFLAKRHYKIKTLRMCKVISQGLIMPIASLGLRDDIELNVDLTETLGVKYIEPEDNIRKADDEAVKLAAIKGKHKKFMNTKLIKYLMQYDSSKKLIIKLLGGRKNTNKGFPTKYISKTDEERCLAADTKILTDQGNIRIADIVNKKLSVKVLSYNEATGNLEYKPVEAVQKYRVNEELIRISFPYKPFVSRTNSIICTRDHKFLTDQGYKEAKDLTLADKIMRPVKCYNSDALELVYGALLGDASINIDRRIGKLQSVGIKFTQGEAQQAYLHAKLSCFADSKVSFYKQKSGYSDSNVLAAFLPVDYYLSNSIIQDCIVDGKKHITKNWVDKLTPLSLAIWYLDDGSLKNRNSNSAKAITFATCGFNLAENELLVNRLADFGIKAAIHTERSYYVIYLNNTETSKFLELIKDYIPTSMKYKTTPEYETLPCKYPVYRQSERLLTDSIKSITPFTKTLSKFSHRYVYDITVADNHNFIANGIISHNCQNMPWILTNKEPFIATEKIDGTSTTWLLVRKPLGRFEFYVCSRNLRLTPDQSTYKNNDNIYWENAIKYDVKNQLKKYLKEHKDLKWVCIQGESYGEDWQGNPLRLQGHHFRAFNFIDSKNGRWNSIEAKKLLESFEKPIPWVPILNERFILPDTIEELLEIATAKSCINTSVLREGIVFRSLDGQISFKAVSPEYLMKNDK